MPFVVHLARAAGLVLAALSSFTVPVTTGGWTSSGPALYQANAVATEPSRESSVYAASSIYDAKQSAIFHSADAGTTWQPLVELLTGEFYSTLLVDPRQPQRVYAGTAGTGNIYRSTDAGDTWTKTGSVSPGCSPSFAPGSTSNLVLAACGTKVLRSQDGGGSWTELTTAFVEAMKLSPGRTGTVLAFGAAEVFRSTDNGGAWVSIATAPAACPGILALRADPSDDDVLVAGAGSILGGTVCGGVFRSVDGGRTWGPNTLPGYYITDVVIDATNPELLFAAASYLPGVLPRGGVFQSKDAGATWANLHIPASGALRLAISPSGRHLHAATPIGVFDRGFRRTSVVEPRD